MLHLSRWTAGDQCYDMWEDDMSHVVTLCYLDEGSARGFNRAFAPW